MHICAHLVHFRKDAGAHDICTSLHSHFSFFAGPSGWAQAGVTRGQCPGPCAVLPPSSALIWPDVGHPAFWGLCCRLTLVPPTSHLSTTALTTSRNRIPFKVSVKQQRCSWAPGSPEPWPDWQTFQQEVSKIAANLSEPPLWHCRGPCLFCDIFHCYV